MYNPFLSMEASKVVVTIHRQPDGDCIGSGTALVRMLRNMISYHDKAWEVRLFSPDRIPAKFKWVLEQAEVDESNIPPQDREYVVAVDTPAEDMLGYPAEKMDFCVDHHQTRTLKPMSTFYVSAPSTASILTRMFVPPVLDKEAATALFVGIHQDTLGFAKNMSHRDFMDLVKLTKAGAEPEAIVDRLNMVSPTVEKELAKCMADLEIREASFGRVAIVVCGQCRLKALARRMTYFDNVRLAIAISPPADDKDLCRLELRTPDGRLHVGKLAEMVGGKGLGGGHARAAGCVLPGPVEHAINLVIQTAERGIRRQI